MAEIHTNTKYAPEDTYRVLVLDGTEGHMPKIIEACKRVGQEVVPCHSIAEAFRFLETKDHVDAFVCEAFMENESVFEFLKKAKADPLHKDCPVMIIAAEPTEIGLFCLPSVAQAAKILGAYKFFHMPKFDINQLMREIKAMLPQHKLPMKEEEGEGDY